MTWQGIARPSACGTIRAAGYRSVEQAMLQLGAGAAPYLATPALPALLQEVRALLAASDLAAATANAPFGQAPSNGKGGTGMKDASAGSGGMKVEPAMSARKSSQKKLRRSREKQVGRALAAADAAAEASASAQGLGIVGSASNGIRGGGRVGCVSFTGAAAVAEREAACAGLSCLAQVVVCCKGHLPLGGRLAIEDALHHGLGLLGGAANVRGVADGKGVAGAREGGNGGGTGGLSRLHHPLVARQFLVLAHACLVTPLVSVERSGRSDWSPRCSHVHYVHIDW